VVVLLICYGGYARFLEQPLWLWCALNLTFALSSPSSNNPLNHPPEPEQNLDVKEKKKAYGHCCHCHCHCSCAPTPKEKPHHTHLKRKNYGVRKQASLELLLVTVAQIASGRTSLPIHKHDLLLHHHHHHHSISLCRTVARRPFLVVDSASAGVLYPRIAVAGLAGLLALPRPQRSDNRSAPRHT